jgi:Na+-driven multidrug efflux pump
MRFQERRFLLTVSALAAATILAFLLLWLAMQLPPLAPLVNKYEVTATLVIPAAILAALSITSTADWMLQAHDKERWLTISGVVNLASFAVLSALVLAHAIDMGGYLWGLAAGKLLQLTVQLWVILHIRDSEPDVEGRTDLPARMPAVDRFEP